MLWCEKIYIKQKTGADLEQQKNYIIASNFIPVIL